MNARPRAASPVCARLLAGVGHCATATAVIAFAVLCSATWAGPGDPDASFGSGGQIATPARSSSATSDTGAVVVQPDGKLVVAGTCDSNSGPVACLTRYLANGTLDASFGTSGTTLSGGPNTINAMVLQRDDKIVVAGGCGAEPWVFCVVRYTASGSLDTSFGAGGFAITPVGLSGYARAIVLQPDGMLVAAGTCVVSIEPGVAAPCFVRYTASGGLDASFGTSGKVHGLYASGRPLRALALQVDGKLVSDGCTGACIVRLNANGSLDAGFGSGGFSEDLESTDASAIAVQPDGYLLVGGRCSGFCVTRVQPNGSVDGAFGSGGRAVIPTGSSPSLRAIALQPDGRVIAAGSCRNTEGATLNCLGRVNADGGVDSHFGVATLVGTGGVPYSVLLQRDGKIVASGSCPGNVCVARFDGGPFGYENCKPDFDGDGRVTAMIDGLIMARVALGITGSAVINGITFAGHASRNTWPQIRNYLVTQCAMLLP